MTDKCGKSTEGAADDTVLGMLRRANAEHFVKAAQQAYERNGGYCYLLDRGLPRHVLHGRDGGGRRCLIKSATATAP
jgi:hypothetical protein